MGYYNFNCPRCGEQNEEWVSVAAWWQDHERDIVEQELTECSDCKVVIAYVFDPKTHELNVEERDTHSALLED